MRNLIVTLLSASVLTLSACVSPPAGWSNKGEIEATVARSIRIGDSKERVQEFLTKQGVKWSEHVFLGPLAPTPHAISASVVTGRRWPVTYSAAVSFSIAKDGKVDRIVVTETATGP